MSNTSSHRLYFESKYEDYDISFDVALVSSLNDSLLKNIITPYGWKLCYRSNKDHPLKLMKIIPLLISIGIHL